MWVATKSWVSTDTIASPHEELNRIEGDSDYIHDGLTWSNVPAMTHKLDWAQTDYPTTAQAKNIDDNIKKFAEMYRLPFTTRDWTGIVSADYRVWNEWETVLEALYDLATIGSPVKYCGSFNCGETGELY